MPREKTIQSIVEIWAPAPPFLGRGKAFHGAFSTIYRFTFHAPRPRFTGSRISQLEMAIYRQVPTSDISISVSILYRLIGIDCVRYRCLRIQTIHIFVIYLCKVPKVVQALNPSPIYYFKCTEGIYFKLSKGKMKKREKE